MPKRKTKRATKRSASSHVNNTECDADTNGPTNENAVIDQEVERQTVAIRAIRDMEIERSLTALRLLKSNISKEQLQTPLLQFCEENLPNVTVSRTDKDGPIVLKWKDKNGDLSMNTNDEGNMISSFFQHMSMAYPDHSTVMASDTHILGMDDSLQTPGATSQRLSVGMTPKTLRVPKQGEMLLSVHGSPLGVYKENNMDAIHEVEEE